MHARMRGRAEQRAAASQVEALVVVVGLLQVAAKARHEAVHGQPLGRLPRLPLLQVAAQALVLEQLQAEALVGHHPRPHAVHAPERIVVRQAAGQVR